MSSLQEIDVTIRPDGSVEVHVRGVAGPACLALTKKLEQYLGGRVVTREHTDDMLLESEDRPDEQVVGDD